MIPPHAGVGSAVGFLAAPIAFETVRSRHVPLDAWEPDAVNALLDAMTAEARALVEPGAAGAAVFVRRTASMRYVGQGHEIAVTLPERALTHDDDAVLRAAFEADYAALFARFIPSAAIEVLTWAVLVTTRPARPAPSAPVAATGRAPIGTGRRAVFDGHAEAAITVPLHARATLTAGARVVGPAVITEDETSTFVSASFDAHIDGAGCIVMDRKTVDREAA